MSQVIILIIVGAVLMGVGGLLEKIAFEKYQDLRVMERLKTHNPLKQDQNVAQNPSRLGANLDDQNLRTRKISIGVKRLTQDLSTYLADTLEQHVKGTDRIAAEYARRGTLNSGMHIKAQYEHVRSTRKSIANHWLETQRSVEDLLLEEGYDHIPDQELKTLYDASEHEKKEALREALQRTDIWFIKRESSFTPIDVAAVRKSVLGEIHGLGNFGESP